MKTRLFLSILCSVCLLSAASLFFGCRKTGESEQHKTVTVYAYDSFVSEWGPGPALADLFKQRTGYTVEFISCGDAAQVLSRAILEKKDPRADVLVGIDNQLFPAAVKEDLLVPHKNTHEENIPESLRFDTSWLLTPYDWGSFAIIWDSESSVPPPRSLQDLTNPEYEKKFILLDPRTSTPGLGFVAWTVAVFGSQYTDFWNALKPNILTLAPGWDTGYGLFIAGEAPLVISYTTSPAYHVEYEQSNRYKALLFDEGHILQIEGAGLVKNAPNPEGGKIFLDFLLSAEAQNILPLTQWMYPVNTAVKLPASYDAAPKPETLLQVNYSRVETAVSDVLSILSR